MNTLAIIGTAGRQADADHINREIYDAMYEDTLETIDRWGIQRGVSGGAAVADHLCVRAFLDGKLEGITLFLPARWNGAGYVENRNRRQDAGSTANRYHEVFSVACDLNSFEELGEAINRGANVYVFEGFKRRNLEVAANCTHMLAYTFGADIEPVEIADDDPQFTAPGRSGLKDGGTAHTWSEAWRPVLKRHVSLTWLEKRLDHDLSGVGLQP